MATSHTKRIASEDIIHCVEINLQGTAITSPDKGGYYCYEQSTNIQAPTGFKFLCASPVGGQWDTGVSIVNVYPNNSGYLVFSAMALQSITVTNSRPFNVFYIVE